MNQNQQIVFFDGVCNLCNSTVNFLMKHNKPETLQFSSLQSRFATEYLKDYQIDTSQLSTIYFYTNGKLYDKSRAVLQIAKHLNAPYRYLNFFSFVPQQFADFIYQLIAKNRYRLLGKKETCRIPTKAELNRFLV